MRHGPFAFAVRRGARRFFDDLDVALPLARCNGDSNQASIEAAGGSVAFSTLNWGFEDEYPKEAPAALGGLSFIVASDVIYSRATALGILQTIAHLAGPSTRALVAQDGRLELVLLRRGRARPGVADGARGPRSGRNGAICGRSLRRSKLDWPRTPTRSGRRSCASSSRASPRPPSSLPRAPLRPAPSPARPRASRASRRSRATSGRPGGCAASGSRRRWSLCGSWPTPSP